MADATLGGQVNRTVEPLNFPVNSTEDYQAFRAALTELPRIPKLVDTTTCPVVYQGDGQTIRLVLRGEESAGALMVSRVVMEPGAAGAPNHHQPREDEFWFCHQGEFVWTVGDRTERVGPGAFAYAPRGVNHAFAQVGEETSVMFTVNTPAGHERGFIGMNRLLADKAAPEEIGRLLANHDFVFEA